MRILQIYELSPMESLGGVEIAIHSLSKELVRLGHEVTVLTGAGNGASRSSVDGIEVINFDTLGLMRRTYQQGRLSFARQAFFLGGLMARKPELRFDVYHGHIYSSGLVALGMAGSNGGVSVNTVHGSYYPAWRELKGLLSSRFYEVLEKQVVIYLSKKVDLQVHVSSYFAEQVNRWGGKTLVIPNGVDERQFNPGVKGCLDGDGPVVLTARRLVRKNGVEHLMRAAEILGDSCRVVVIGDGPERERLERLSKRAGNVVFLGGVAHDDMPGLLASADIAVVPSLIEASSLFMLEAMAMGKAVVASSVGGLPEALGDGGVLVPPGDPTSLARAISSLLSDAGRRDKLGKRGRSRVVENYTWEKVAKMFEAEYLRLTGV